MTHSCRYIWVAVPPTPPSPKYLAVCVCWEKRYWWWYFGSFWGYLCILVHLSRSWSVISAFIVKSWTLEALATLNLHPKKQAKHIDIRVEFNRTCDLLVVFGQSIRILKVKFKLLLILLFYNFGETGFHLILLYRWKADGGVGGGDEARLYLERLVGKEGPSKTGHEAFFLQWKSSYHGWPAFELRLLSLDEIRTNIAHELSNAAR